MDLPTHPRRSKSDTPSSSNIWGVEKPQRATTPDKLETDVEFDPQTHEITIMAPSRVSTMMPPKHAQSVPTTPIYGTFTGPKEAPNHWFTPVTHKEKLAIFTIERIPSILMEEAQTQAADDPTKYFSPTLYPLAERMKFSFSRSMAHARFEVDSGKWTMQEAQNAADQTTTATPMDIPLTSEEIRIEASKGAIYCDDVMTSLEVEAFLAGMEDVHHPERVGRVVFRRYWRILAKPGDRAIKTGGVVSAGSTTAVHVRNDLQKIMKEKWAQTPKSLLAEFAVRADGIAWGGRMVFEDDD